jgi:hypothetical protein
MTFIKFIKDKIDFSTNSALALWLFFSCIFTYALSIQLKAKSFNEIGVLIFTTLTFMVALTALIYARAQAWRPCSTQRRCLYAAEKCFAGTLLFGLTWVAIFSIGIVFKELFPYPDICFWGYILILNLVLNLSAFQMFIRGIEIVTHRMPHSKKHRKFLNSLKRG